MSTDNHINYTKMFGTRWRAYYKHGLMNQTVVYGESEEEAKKNALAEYRKNSMLLDNWTADMVVDKVVKID